MVLRKIKIPKNNGKIREVYSVDPELKAALRTYLPILDALVEEHDKINVIFGFRNGRNPVLNAFQHIGFEYTLSIDLEDFFGHVRPEHVSHIVSDEIIEKCFFNGYAPQGLPTSPGIANLAFTRADRTILREISKLSSDIVYTRYADDLIFSFNERRHSRMIEFLVNQIISAHGFKLNERKTQLQSTKNGRRIITGVGVDQKGVYPTRKTLKKIRAAGHKGNIRSETGLLEWSRCKLPKKVTNHCME